MAKYISVRLEGGIGDHLLGMRLLYFIRQRYPGHKIIVYSDCGGGRAQLDTVKMSPFVSKVVPVYHRRLPTVETWGALNNIKKNYLEMMQGADLFFDAWGNNFFLEASKTLDASFLKILNHQPELAVPAKYNLNVEAAFSRHKGEVFVGLNIAKYDFNFLQDNRNQIIAFLRVLLKNQKVTILNFYTSGYKFPHWPKERRIERERLSRQESIKTGELWNLGKRVIPLVDLPIPLVAAFLSKCSYFIGVDNGLKHLAWALDVPHTFFYPGPPSDLYFILRWMPDLNRVLAFNCSGTDLLRHISQAAKAIGDR